MICANCQDNDEEKRVCLRTTTEQIGLLPYQMSELYHKSDCAFLEQGRRMLPIPTFMNPKAL